MAHLNLTGTDRDGRCVLLVDSQGNEYTVVIDAALRAAVNRDRVRQPKQESRMESALRPREIQARIRAGETVEQVAEVARTSVERVMPFATPVLAERAHMAERAQLASIRRRGGDAGARTLGEAVAEHLRADNIDPEGVEWDAWRREDGRWTLTALYDTPGRTGLGTFTFDLHGNFATADDDDARWVIGDLADAAPQPPARDDLQAARERRLTAIPDEPDDIEATIELTRSRPQDPAATAPALGLGPVTPRAEEPARVAETTAPLDGPGAPADAPESTDRADAPAEASQSELDLDVAPEPERPKKPAKRRRASVPSWDEIMFGGGTGRGE